ncbi:MAG: hypothetical protein WBC04_24795 [Candidatus Acidiferrales bacterium]
MHARSLFHSIAKPWLLAPAVLLTAGMARSQDLPREPARQQADSITESLRDLQAEVRELKSVLKEMRAEAAGSRAEILEMRRELEATREQLASAQPPSQESGSGPGSPAGGSQKTSNDAGGESAQVQTDEERLAKLEEDQRLLGSKIDEQYQTKVESASKYRVRLSGIVLLNAFANRGAVDNEDFPDLAVSRAPLISSGDFGFTLRQSEVGLEVFGPEVGGAKASANIQLDFAGGFADAPNGVTFGFVRLRTGTVRLDWPRTSLVAGQDALFFSPLSPTSIASLAVPALSYAGNLWSWTPQVRIERRLDLSTDSTITVQGGILDPLTGEPPDSQLLQTLPETQFLRSRQAGEQSGQPGYGARVAWSHRAFEQTISIGLGGYYSRQNWGLGRSVDAWAGMSDWTFPLGRWFGLTGEFYTGRALGGLGGGIGRSVLFEGSLADPATTVQGLRSMGGWSQLKFKPTAKLEFNGAFGQENPLAADIRRFPDSPSYFYNLIVRNQSAMANFIYRPRSDLLLSLEYRHLRTFSLNNDSVTANHINMSIGVLF